MGSKPQTSPMKIPPKPVMSGKEKAQQMAKDSLGKKRAKPPYNPYGKGATATPENMAPGKP